MLKINEHPEKKFKRRTMYAVRNVVLRNQLLLKRVVIGKGEAVQAGQKRQIGLKEYIGVTFGRYMGFVEADALSYDPPPADAEATSPE